MPSLHGNIPFSHLRSFHPPFHPYSLNESRGGYSDALLFSIISQSVSGRQKRSSHSISGLSKEIPLVTMPKWTHHVVSRVQYKQKMTFLTDEQIERLKKIEAESVGEQLKKRENERILAEERRKVFNEVYGLGNIEDAPKLSRLCKGDVSSTSNEQCSCSYRRKTRSTQ